MNVRCKMRVVNIIKMTSNYGTGPQYSDTVKLSAVSGEENKTWSKYTPSGSVELTITNPETFDQFKIGEFFFVDFTAAPATEAEEKK